MTQLWKEVQSKEEQYLYNTMWRNANKERLNTKSRNYYHANKHKWKDYNNKGKHIVDKRLKGNRPLPEKSYILKRYEHKIILRFD